jgi:hypothetical protein
MPRNGAEAQRTKILLSTDEHILERINSTALPVTRHSREGALLSGINNAKRAQTMMQHSFSDG